ncbi:MAG: DUF167 domain-containing protein [Deltaproteobacteria bacterium]|nr:DUF167 domain-containing protein [Deltaproteobacteria bacterium]
MRIKVIVKPSAKREAIEKTADGDYRVFVKAPAREGKANEAVINVKAQLCWAAKQTRRVCGV